MINVIITETGAQEALSIKDQNGIDYITDFIGNHGAFVNGSFSYDEENDTYTCDQDTYDWWAAVVAQNERLGNRIAHLRATYGSNAVHEVISGVGDVDLENLAAAVNAVLDEAFGTAE